MTICISIVSSKIFICFSTAFIGYYYTVITLLLYCYYTIITRHTWLRVIQLFSWPYDGLSRTSGWPSSMQGARTHWNPSSWYFAWMAVSSVWIPLVLRNHCKSLLEWKRCFLCRSFNNWRLHYFLPHLLLQTSELFYFLVNKLHEYLPESRDKSALQNKSQRANELV